MATREEDRSAASAISAWIRRTRRTIGRLLATGKIGHADEGPDGRMTATIRIPPDELVLEPSVLVLPHGGDLELELINDDQNTHCALLPSNGDSQFIWLVNHSGARPRSTSTARATTGTARPPATTRAGA